ncbi:exonuclease domain-containing protein [Actinoplanes rectilineatus]|uniref:exonuclease domain-containing protein n=1 Tax=Actinoplanes rectilineatus TaxID=113571 RepID=UPI0009FB5547|nr:exonuclease domain-containing protein [Actinoplanes rectilineatus]
MESVDHPLHWFRPGYLTRDEDREDGRELDTLEFVAVDFETTGLDSGRDRIVEVAACRFTADGTILDEYASRVDPVTASVASTAAVHGLTDASVGGAPVFGDVWPGLSRLMSGAVVVAHNLAFEDGFLRQELRRAGVDLAGTIPGVCTMVASWSHFDQPSYKQDAVFRTLTGTSPHDAHTALGDVRNLSVIVASLLRRVPGLRYAGPAPVELPAIGGPKRMYARPIVEQAVQWNSLPLSSLEFPYDEVAFRVGARELLAAADDPQRREALVALMGASGLGADQFCRTLAATIVALLAEPLPWDDTLEETLDRLVDAMGSREFAQTVAAGIRDHVGPDRVTGRIHLGERWQVPADHPGRDELVAALKLRGVHVLKTRRTAVDAWIDGDRLHRGDEDHDLDAFFADRLRLATVEAHERLLAHADELRDRHPATAGIPLADASLPSALIEPEQPSPSALIEPELAPPFVLIEPELAPDWRWIIDPDYEAKRAAAAAVAHLPPEERERHEREREEFARRRAERAAKRQAEREETEQRAQLDAERQARLEAREAAKREEAARKAQREADRQARKEAEWAAREAAEPKPAPAAVPSRSPFPVGRRTVMLAAAVLIVAVLVGVIVHPVWAAACVLAGLALVIVDARRSAASRSGGDQSP